MSGARDDVRHARVDEPSSMKLLAAAAIAVWKATLAAQPQSSLSHAWRSTETG
jgi:hypothetical protein